MNRQMFIAYILGTMLEADRLALAERYFADDELFDQLLAVETDLLDQYVRGQLAPEERKRFERYLQRLPDCRHNIGVATALMKAVADKQPATSTLPELSSAIGPETASWWRSWFTPVQKPQVALLCSVAAVAMLSVIASIWLIIYTKQLIKENEQLSAKAANLAAEQQDLEQHQKKFQQQNADQLAEIEQLQAELEEVKRRGGAKADARLQRPSSSLVSLELAAASRTSSIPDKVYLGPGVKFVSLIARLEGRKNYTGYHAVVQTTEGKLIWEKNSTQSVPSGKSIVLRLAARELPQAKYKLTLILKTSDQTDIPRDYYFTVVKE